jgi:hypothetical protein
MKNQRLFWAGIVALICAAGIYAGINNIAGQSNDPAEVMRIAGQAAGIVGGIGIAMMLASFFVKPPARRRKPEA